MEKWDRLMTIRERVLKLLEIARQEKLIGSGLEARLMLEKEPLLEEYLEALPALFVVSAVELGNCDVVDKAIGQKCERCWKYVAREGAQVCEPCRAALTEMGITESE